MGGELVIAPQGVSALLNVTFNRKSGLYRFLVLNVNVLDTLSIKQIHKYIIIYEINN